MQIPPLVSLPLQRDLQQGKLGTNELGDAVFFVDEDALIMHW
jgi:hypothetical protein